MSKLNESLQTAKAVATSNVQQSVTEQIVLDYFFHQELDSKLSQSQKAAFIATCIMTGLNPIKREIYAIPRWDRQKNGYTLTTVTSYTTYIKRAAHNPLYRGFELESSGQGNDLQVTCKVHIDGYHAPISATAKYAEYNANTHIWKTKPTVMLEKVAISRAMRWAFPEDLEFLPYTTEEMGDITDIGGSSSKNENKAPQEPKPVLPTQSIAEPIKVEEEQAKEVQPINKEDVLVQDRWNDFKNWSKKFHQYLTDEDIDKLNQVRIEMDQTNLSKKLHQAKNIVNEAVAKQSPTPDQIKEAEEKIEKLFIKYPNLDNKMMKSLQTLEAALNPVAFYEEFKTMLLSEFQDYCKHVRKYAGGDNVFEKGHFKTSVKRINRMTLDNCDEVVKDWGDIEAKIEADEERLKNEAFLQGTSNEPPF